jgi:hypothetical protein
VKRDGSGAFCGDGGAEDRLEQSRFRSNRDLARSAGFCPRFSDQQVSDPVKRAELRVEVAYMVGRKGILRKR